MSEDFDRESILKKIRDMLALANPENGGTQGEIENASTMAKRLMDKYNISLVDAMNDEKVQPDLFISKTANYTVAKMKAWHWSLARAICRIVGTRHYSMGSWGHSERRKRDAKNARNMRIAQMTFYGFKNNVEIACELFDKWVDRIDRMGTTAVSEYIKEMEEEYAEEMEDQGVTQFRFLRGLGEAHPQTWRNGWLDGCLAGIHQALSEDEERREDEERKAQGLKPLSGLSYREKRDILRKEEEAAEALRLSGLLAAGSIPVNTSTALAVFNEKLDEAYAEHSKGFRSVNVSSSGRSNYGAFAAGHSVGKGIRLNSKELGKG